MPDGPPTSLVNVPRKRPRILFVAEAVTLAHAARSSVLAKCLDPGEYDVYFACDPRYRRLLGEASYAEREIFSIPSDRFLKSLARGSPLYDSAILRRYVQDDLRLIDEIQPDLIVGDFRLSLAVSAPLSRIPFATIANAYWSPYCRMRTPMPEWPLSRAIGVGPAAVAFRLTHRVAFAYHTRAINRVRRENGLASLGLDLRHVYTFADHTLYADIPSLAPTHELPSHHRYLGPIHWSPSQAVPSWWDETPNDLPFVYVTLGSSGRSDLLDEILAGLSDLDVRILVATAGRSGVRGASDRVLSADYLPGSASASRASLVVCNGGSPSTYQALCQGTPVLGIASNLDQHLNMRGIVRARAGVLLRSELVSPSTVFGAAKRLLSDPAYRRAASKIAIEASTWNAESRFNSFVRDFAPAHV